MTTPAKAPWWFFAAVTAWAVAANAGLAGAWAHDPSNRFGAPAFALWAGGCLLVARSRRPLPARTTLWIAALALLLAGYLGGIQFLKQASLAVLLASLCRGPLALAVMLAAAASWTPAWGWFFSQTLGQPLDFVRPLFAITGTFVAWRSTK